MVDGVPFNGKLSDINPTDIASVNVSKDAVSNSLYGSRAAGGVVMITTKTGRKDKVSINFDGSWGWHSVRIRIMTWLPIPESSIA